jgi:hypothetical protein
MRLLNGDPFETREYSLELSTSPGRIEPHVPFVLRLAVGDPANGSPIEAYEEVHEKRYHLFVISQDLSVFEHLHPTLVDGAWEVTLTLPKAGYYNVLSDFVPKGGSPQLISRSIVTSDYEGDLVSDTSIPTPDETYSKTVGDIAVELHFEPQPLLAGQFGHLVYDLRDANTGNPIADLEPYLGAFGHTLIMSADLLDAVHSHPTITPGHEGVIGHGGPQVTFEGYLPRPGVYRAWTQFQRNGRVSTVSFTFDVLSIEEAFPIRLASAPIRPSFSPSLGVCAADN